MLGGVRGVLRKYEICIQMCEAQQDLAGNMFALENGNDLLFKDVAEGSISRKKKIGEIQNMSHTSRREF